MREGGYQYERERERGDISERKRRKKGDINMRERGGISVSERERDI